MSTLKDQECSIWKEKLNGMLGTNSRVNNFFINFEIKFEPFKPLKFEKFRKNWKLI